MGTKTVAVCRFKTIHPVKFSNFVNRYGGLHLMVCDGQHFLEMEGCFGAIYFGPMEERHVDAFNLLCELNKFEHMVPVE